MKLSWKTVLIGVGILLVLLSGAWYGWKEYRYLKERAAIKEGQGEIRTRLENENASIRSERDQLRQKIIEINEEMRKLKNKYAQLESEKQNIVVPTDPGALADGFHKRGYRSAVILNKP